MTKKRLPQGEAVKRARTRLDAVTALHEEAVAAAKTVAGKAAVAAKKLEAAKQAEDDRLNAAFATLLDLRARVRKNGKGKPKIDIFALSQEYNCSYQRLLRAANDRGRTIGAVKRGRQPNVSDQDIEVARRYVEEEDAALDNLGESEVLGQLQHMAQERGTPYKTGGQLGMGLRSRRKLQARLKAVDFVMSVGLPTDINRVFTTADTRSIKEFLDSVGELLERVPLLKTQPRRWANLDESDKSGRDEKAAKKVKAVTTVKRIKVKQRRFGKRKELRTRVLAAGNGKMSMVMCLGADSNIVTTSYLIAGKSEPKDLLAASADGSDFLPGIGAEYFEDTVRVRVYATAKGSMTKEVLATIIEEQILPAWRRRIPTGPLALILDAPRSHRPTKRLLQKIIDEKDLYLIFLPHNTSHVLQPCDLDFFKEVKQRSDKVYRNVLTCTRFANAYLDSELEVKYKQRK